VAFTALLFYFYFFGILVAYVPEVFSSYPVALSWSNDCTRSFFTSGPAGCPSSCYAIPVVALFALSFGSL
jgi:hypothetical protein